MGCWIAFKGGLAFDKPITDSIKKEFDDFIAKSSEVAYVFEDYSNTWRFIDELLVCDLTKFGEYCVWLEHIYNDFFMPRGFNMYGSLLMSGEGDYDRWSLRRVFNGQFLPGMEMDEIVMRTIDHSDENGDFRMWANDGDPLFPLLL
jgi:hypothetical protein